MNVSTRSHAAVEDLGLRERLDCIVIWNHGIQFEDAIVEMLVASGIQPRAFFRRAPRNLRKTLRIVYADDYAPRYHLRSKLRYLRALPTEHLVILAGNSEPTNEVCGSGRFRHLTSTKLNQVKWMVRSEFNPRNETGITHDHVIHATDSEHQACSLMKNLGFSDYYWFYRNSSSGMLPPWVPGTEASTLRRISLGKLSIGKLYGSRWKFKTTDCTVSRSVQFRALQGDWDAYSAHVSRFRGTAIKAYHAKARFISMAANARTQPDFLARNPIIVTRSSTGDYRVLDGAHRAAIALQLGYEEIPVREV